MQGGWGARMGAKLRTNKTTPPSLPCVLDRARLFRELDAARSARLIWIHAPAGSGKTTLVASYVRKRKKNALVYRIDASDADVASLFHELLHTVSKARAKRLPRFSAGQLVSLGAFARRFFSALFAAAPAGSLLLLDDYQHVADIGVWTQVVEQALLAAPRGARVVVMSRVPPPAALARYALGGELVTIDAAKLALTPEEALALARLRSPERAKNREQHASIAQLNARAAGWMAGFVLLLEGAALSAPPADEDLPHEQPLLFEYLAAEVLAHMDPNTARLLVETSVLPVVTVAGAVAATGIPNAGVLLARLQRQGLFVDEERRVRPPAYRFHPLFRSFLLHRAEETLSIAKLVELRAAGAAALLEGGYLEDALELFRQAGDLQRLELIVLERAMALLEAGRVHVLRRWLSLLPEARFEANAWLVYWRATAGFFSAEPQQAARFTRAFDAFAAQNDVLGQCLAATGAIGANVAEGTNQNALERWMAELERLRPHYSALPAPLRLQVALGMVSAMTFRKPAEAVERERWVSEAIELANAVGASNQRQMALGQVLLLRAFRGEVELGKRILALLGDEAPRDAEPMTKIVVAFGQTLLHWMAGENEAGLRASDAALAGEDGSIVRLWGGGIVTFGGMCAANLGQRDDVERYAGILERMARSGRPLDVGSSLFFNAYTAFTRGQLEKSRRAMRAVIPESNLDDNPFLFATNLIFEAGILGELGEIKEAHARLDEARKLERFVDHPVLAFWNFGMRAALALAEGRPSDARALLREAWRIGRRIGAFATLALRPSVLSALAAEALRAGIETEYTLKLIARRGLPATAACRGVAAWPWPLRLRLFGGLSLVLDGNRVAGFGRSRMPPRLLAAIAALGGRRRAVSVERLVDALWPDAEGDRGMHAFEVTLVRLRKALGAAGRGAIHLEGGRVWLDEGLCTTDLDELDAVCERITSGDDDDEQLFAVYRAPLLGDDELGPELMAARERARKKVAAAITSLAQRLQRSGGGLEEGALYARALAADERLLVLLPGAGRSAARAGQSS